MNLASLSDEQLNARLAALNDRYDAYAALGLSLNMARGKPGRLQLNLCNGMLDPALLGDYLISDGSESRNYGLVEGIPECRQLFAELMDVDPANVIIFGNSSLAIMYDLIAQYMTFGAGDTPWSRQGKLKFLCPVPGYDRHFAILAHFGIEMIAIPMDETGPDMDAVEAYVQDPAVKGLICVPMYSNPTGYTFSDETVRRFAALRPAAPDFRVFWDNAYCVHHLSDTPDRLLNIFKVAREYGTEDHFIEVVSTSKISFPGAGVAALAASATNVAAILERMKIQIICHDKVNQLRHVRYFKNLDGILAHMKKHQALLVPNFNAVLEAFEANLTGIATWTKPNGGYFISLNVPDGCAKRTVALCKAAGVTLTGAGATYPYGKDPADRNIRIAPTFPSRDELCKAVEILCVCVEKAAVEKMLSDRSK
ncbi:MAG: aminotransferase class I/II-fold pyridoxal phosphate-dependent enzyme [Clostridia bacterium]|nr:aminotransferase class I/II-fold pyridoxal phosphate-dependent enzyme [Clostridia bacterium]